MPADVSVLSRKNRNCHTASKADLVCPHRSNPTPIGGEQETLAALSNGRPWPTFHASA